ncbi:MAG: aminotransferase class V-fold PLP-dependent enzyme [Sphingopyxis sp.]|uniref:aminotransferase class V-fold PLP-dependent enzyme n=1 Tax=Sphingopyxis sp. TaxID=1908224 RepID=UPI003D810B8B
MSDHRARFEVPGPGPYMLSHSVGCLPRTARARVERDLWQPWATLGSDGWPEWLGAIDRFRAVLAGLFAVEAREICPQPSVSAALASLLSGLPREAGRDRLVASAHSFPSIGFALQQFERLGYRLDLIPEDEDPSSPETWTRRIDGSVAAVVAMHVHSNLGLIAPAAAIAAAARGAGAVSILDICQSAGIVPIDLPMLGVDAAIGSCVKWLCGGPGAGYLWVRGDRLADFAPVNVGWFSHADPFAFDIHDFRYADDARRFWGGTPSIAPYVLATAGIEAIAEIGVDAVFAHNRAFIAAFADAAEVDLDVGGRGGTLCLTAADIAAVADALTRLPCRFDRRGTVLRLSPHIYNTVGEAEAIGQRLRGQRLALARI